VIIIGIFDWFKKNRAVTVSRYQMITDDGNGFYSWNGQLYKSDIVRSCIRPKARAIGKAVGKHIRKGLKDTQVNPDVYIRFLLEEPNPYMTGQQMQEKLITQLELNNNAFAYINRDLNGLPMEIYPITAITAEAVNSDSGILHLRFTLKNGQTVTFRYTDIIHLRKDYNDNEIFGDSPAETLAPLMEIINTTDQGIVKAIKNSNVIKWLLKYNASLRPEDIKKQTKQFVDDYLSVESDSVGVAGLDSKFDAQQIEPKDYVPNEKQMDSTVQRIYAFFNTNEKIIHGNYSEDEWISYYESAVEPDITQLSNECTRKLFSRRERGHGNKIIFESSNLTFASMATKLNLVQFVDRGIMSPNEVREVLNMSPYDGGDEIVRRLDTAPVQDQTAEGGE
jgi:HK97 family phage portal protein